MGDLQFAKIYLQPPLNSNRPSSDVDFGDENTAGADTSNLSDNQILSCCIGNKMSEWIGDCRAK